MKPAPYLRLSLMALCHFVLMYVLMYAMVNVAGNARPNINQAYMALLMTSPMLMLELWLMGSMYPKKAVNGLIFVLAAFLFLSSFFLIREQAFVSDEQFLNSMIPHHAGAILMCEQADLNDEQVKQLCANIVSGQQAEIEWMNAKLESLR